MRVGNVGIGLNPTSGSGTPLVRNKRPLLVGLFLVLFLLLYHWPENDYHGNRIYDSPHVSEAPAATPSGSFTDQRGTYERRVYGTGANQTYVNMVFTRAGNMRSGDLHKCEQVNHIIWGRARLTTLVHGADVERELVGGETVVIPPHVPHLYHFMEDTLMTEVWRAPHKRTPCAFSAWYYHPYRERIAAASLERTPADPDAAVTSPPEADAADAEDAAAEDAAADAEADAAEDVAADAEDAAADGGEDA